MIEDTKSLAPPRRPRASPYQGLVPYAEEDAEYFFGRDAARDLVIDSLLAYRVSVVYGPSGVGKSSLLRAGVARHLREDALRHVAEGEPPEYLAVVFGGWAEDPIARLKQAIQAAVEELCAGPGPLPSGSLTETIAAASDRLGGSLLVILDQFEEYFLYHGVDFEPGSVGGELVYALTRRDNGANFAISIREDALASLDRLTPAIPSLLDNLVRIDHLDRAAGQEAIEKPLDEWNRLEASRGETVSIERGLVDAVLAGVATGRLRFASARADAEPAVPAPEADERVQAPYLQLVMRRLWDEEMLAGSRVLRLETLERLGGAERIVATHLDRVMAALPRRQRAVAARIFRYLVTPSGTKIAHRARDLAEYAATPEAEVEGVLEKLTRDARVLTPAGRSRYEIYHDALATPILEWRRQWDRDVQRRRERRRLLVIGSFVAGTLGVLAVANALDPLELATVDARFAVRGDRAPARDIVLVNIDDASLNKMHTGWPFKRRFHAQAINVIARQRPKAIAYDVQFTDPTDRRDDEALATSVQAADGRVVLATSQVDEHGRTNILGGDDVLRELHARPGHAGFPNDSTGAVRRLDYSTDGLETFAAVTSEVATGHKVKPSDVDGTWIDFSRPPGKFREISFWRVRSGKVPPSLFRSKIVVVGLSSASLYDVHPTPTTDAMPGPELQANAIDTIRRHFPLNDPPGIATFALVVILGLLVPLASLRYRLMTTLAVAVAGAGAYVVLTQVAFNAGTVLPLVYPLGALLVSTIAVAMLDVAAAGRGGD